MARTVIILGAGASADCGTPLMGNFLDVARDVLRSNAAYTNGSAFQDVFDAIAGLQRVHSKARLDLYNIESIYTTFEIATLLSRLPGTREEQAKRMLTSLEKLIVTTLDAKTQFGRVPTAEMVSVAHDSYTWFQRLVEALDARRTVDPVDPVAIITFNYDIAADVALDRIGLGPEYALPEFDRRRRKVRLLKLHGSLNWGQADDGRIVPLSLDEKTCIKIAGRRRPVESHTLPVGQCLRDLVREQTSIRVGELPVIVPPMLGKISRSKGLTTVWAQAAKDLSEAESIYVMGYSLPETDTFFPRLLALGLEGETVLHEFRVFDPDPSVEGRYRSLLGPGAESRFAFRSFTFTEACSFLRDRVS